jgi:Leucine-rich repeat (LRR) protein
LLRTKIYICVNNVSGLTNLDSLGLAHNELRLIPARAFSDLEQLNSLEIDGNLISHLDPDAFVGLEGE